MGTDSLRFKLCEPETGIISFDVNIFPGAIGMA